MTDGIKLKFDEKDQATIDEEHSSKKECFGGVRCIYCEHNTDTVILNNGTVLQTHAMICSHTGEPVVKFDHCPLGYWVKLAVPIGWQNLTLEERIKWKQGQL